MGGRHNQPLGGVASRGPTASGISFSEATGIACGEGRCRLRQLLPVILLEADRPAVTVMFAYMT